MGGRHTGRGQVIRLTGSPDLCLQVLFIHHLFHAVDQMGIDRRRREVQSWTQVEICRVVETGWVVTETDCARLLCVYG